MLYLKVLPSYVETEIAFSFTGLFVIDSRLSAVIRAEGYPFRGT